MKRRCIGAVAVILSLVMILFPLSMTVSGEIADIAETAAEPVFNEPQPVDGGLCVSWKAMSGISAYRLYRWYTDGRGWVALTDTEELSYIDRNLSAGVSYRYRLAGISATGTVITGTAVCSHTYKEIARITSAKLTANGIKLSWSLPEGINRTALYRKGNGWKRIATTYEREYTDTDMGIGGEYTYTVRALNDDGSFNDDDYDRIGCSVIRLATPEISASVAAGGIKISWKAVAGAELYRVFYIKSGNWTAIGNTKSTEFTDTSAKSGETRTYTVRCLSSDGSYTSYFDTSGKSVYFTQTPELKEAQAANNGVKIVWNASKGAYSYRVFRRSANGWQRLGTTSNTSYTDTTANQGNDYTYTVRSMDSKGEYCSFYDVDGISCKYLEMPKLKAVTNIVDGVKVSWAPVHGAEKYRVYVYGSSGWKKLAETFDTSYTDTAVDSGSTYRYTVRCIDEAGERFLSGHTSGMSVYYVAAPLIYSLSNTNDGVQITWEPVKGAGQYRVYYYGSNGWTRLGNTTASSFIDRSAVSGEARTYTVRCMNSEGTAFLSWYRDGVKQEYIDTPKVGVTYNANSVRISWSAPEGAELYRVYKKIAGEWKTIAQTVENTYDDKSVVSGETYTYTVQCMNAYGTAIRSDYDREGKSIRFIEMPKISSVRNIGSGAFIEWKAAAGADRYRVYVKSSSGWTRLGETDKTSFTDISAVPGKSYTYTIRCVSSKGAFESDFDRNGFTFRSDYIATPSPLAAEPALNGVRVIWKAVDSAWKYRVYVKTGTGWTKIGETEDNEFTDTSAESGNTYRYTVRCITESGAFASDFDRNGAKCFYIAAPKISSLSLDKDGVIIKWDASAGAENYRVYRKNGSGWSKLVTTTGLSFKDTTIGSGLERVYTVRCLTADSSAFTSDFDREGKSIYFVSAPEMTYYGSSSDKISISWNIPQGASLFRVYKKVNGAWKKQKDTYDNYFTDTDVTAGNTYKYTVRCLSDDGKKFYSWYDEEGFVVTATSSPANFKYYDQGDYDYPYGDDTIAYSGCGPTCFAMVASTLTGRTIDPIDAVSWCGNDYYVDHVGTRWDYFYAASERFGIRCTAQYDDYQFDLVIKALKEGKLVISAQSAGLFTRGGHFITLAGLDSDGNVIVYDPNGGNNYIGASITPQGITASGTQYWVFDN